jgi:hypothetical protein
MSRVLTVGEICEAALRKIGAYAINDSGARKAEMDVAITWLDLMIGHTAAIRRRWWLVPGTAPLTLQEGVAAYPLRATLPGAPEIQDVVAVWRVDLQSGVRSQVEVMRRQEWEARGQSAAGPVSQAFYDRLDTPTLLLNPVPGAPLRYRLDVVYQAFPPEISSTQDEVIGGFRRAWSLWAVTALAAEIGDGPVRKLPGDEVRAARSDATRLLNELDAWDGQEQADEPRRTVYNDF